jgi:hypothetical protein
MGFDASVMMESIGQVSKEAYDKDITGLFAERLGITTEVIGRNPLMIRISGDDDDPVRSVIKGMVCRKVRSIHGDSLGVYSADGVLTFTDAG